MCHFFCFKIGGIIKNMKNKKEMDSLTKMKLIMSVEYLAIALVFLVVAILKLTGVMNSSDVRAKIFNFVTLAGSVWIIGDFIWASVSKKRKEKVDYLDKSLMLPLGIYLFIYNMVSIIIWDNAPQWYKYGMSAAFIYIFLTYSFFGVYHYFFPNKSLILAVEEEKKEQELEAQKALEQQEKNKVENESENKEN